MKVNSISVSCVDRIVHVLFVDLVLKIDAKTDFNMLLHWVEDEIHNNSGDLRRNKQKG
jgi:hypothetical protein